MTSRTENEEESSGAESDAAHESLQRADSILSIYDPQVAPLKPSTEDTREEVDHLERMGSATQNPRTVVAPPAKSEEKLLEGEGSLGLDDEPVFPSHDRLGWLATTVLVVSTLLILGVIGFLWFLWMSPSENKSWHGIAVRNWITRAVTLSSVVVRTSVSLQATAGTSMLAGLALERAQILILHLASVSTMRNANAGPYMLLWLMFKAFRKNPKRWSQPLLPLLILTLAIVSLLTEFTSTTLLSDLKQGTIPGRSSSSTTATNFAYDIYSNIPFISRGTVWTKKPPFYPVFAEYHEDPEAEPADAADTGLTLRAFLPIQDQEQRSMLRNFSGRATVIDSSVRCIRPQLTLEKGHYSNEAVIALSGQIAAIPGQSTNFSCVLPSSDTSPDGNGPNNWQIGMTYLGQFPNSSFAPLRSQFRERSSNASYGMAFLVVNITAGSLLEWRSLLGVDGGEFGTFGGSGAQPRSYRGHNEWAELIFTANESLIMSASLCYVSYDSVILNITAAGGSNRTEPSAKYSLPRQSFDYSNIRQQLGQSASGGPLLSPEDRGILSIAKRSSWLPGEGDYARSEWLLDTVRLKLDGDPNDTQDYYSSSSITKNVTAYLYDAPNPTESWPGLPRLSPDPSMTALFQQLLQNQGSIAFALQSILTIFTGMTYYDQLQQFNSPNKIDTTPFILVNRPHSIRGLVAVTAVLAAHLLLMGAILYLFLSQAVMSTIGNSWQTLAQIMRGDALELVKVADLATDKAVEEKVKQERWQRRLVGLKLFSNNRRVKLVFRNSPSGLAKMMQNASYKKRGLRARRPKPRTNEK